MVKRAAVTALLVAGIIASSGLAVAAATTRAVKPLKLVYHERRAAVAPAPVSSSTAARPVAPHGISGYFEPARLPPIPFLLGLSAPTGHGWADGVVNTASTTRSFFGGEVCSSRRFAYRTTQVVLNPGLAAGYKVQCPRNYPKPISGVEFPVSGNHGDVIVAESDPLGRSWITALKNLGAEPETYAIVMFCAPRSQHVVLLSTHVDTIGPHQIDMPTGRCPRAEPHAIGGYLFPARKTAWGDIALATSTPLNAAHRIWGTMARNLTSQPQQDVIGTVCLG